VGGCDIVEEMDASGELQEILNAGASGREGESLDDRLRALTTQADVVLFMKVFYQRLRTPYLDAWVLDMDSKPCPK